MARKCRIKALCLFALILTLFLIIVFPSDIAYAVMPQHYVSDVIDKGLEWWSDDKYLGLDTLKHTVQSWKADESYDFDYLKTHPIIVAIIDSGIDLEHEVFVGKYDENGVENANAVDKNGVGKYDVLLRDKNGKPIVLNTAKGYSADNVTDDESRRHGTHVCGIVATLIHALDLEEYIKILPIKASAKGDFDSDSVKNALEYAVSMGADVINMSLSSESESFANIKYSNVHKSAILVAAAGNDSSRVKRYPAALSNVIGVMNYTKSANGIELSSKSNYGTWQSGTTVTGYDVCAPGTDILSARGQQGKFISSAGDESEYYKSLSGTSMASPIVAFGGALITLKYKALAGDRQMHKSADELARLVRNASMSTLTKGGVKYKIFDINALVGIAWHEASIEINDSALAKQHLGSLEKVKYKLNVLPQSDIGNGSVEWFANDVKIGEGFEIEYFPEIKVGMTDIKAIWTHSDKGNEENIVVECNTQLEVDYMLISANTVSAFEMNVTSDDVEVSDLTACELGTVYHFEISNTRYLSSDDVNRLQWFVNDELKYIGSEFDFTPQNEGTYKVRVELNDYSSKATTLKVLAPPAPDVEHKNELKVYTIVCVSLIAVVVLAVAVMIMAKYLSKAKKNDKL